MANVNIFTFGSSASLVVGGTASTSVTLPSGSGTTFRICNDGSSTVFIDTATAATTAGSTPLLANTVELFTFSTATALAAICATGNSTTIRVTRGQGV